MNNTFFAQIGLDANGDLFELNQLVNSDNLEFTYTKSETGIYQIYSSDPVFMNSLNLPICYASVSTPSNFTNDNLEVKVYISDGNCIILNGYKNGVLSDECFGDFAILRIEFFNQSDYTDSELSAISHAQSILYRAGLKELASSIGAPRPKKPQKVKPPFGVGFLY